MTSFPFVEDEPDRVRETIPRRLLDLELLLARPRERVELGLASRFRLPPLGFEPAFLLEPVQRRVQRSLIDLDGLARDLLEPLRYPVAMRRIERQDLKDQHVERALRDRESGGRHVASTFDM
jgi:hypothetical protein